MSVVLNHMIVRATDRVASAMFLAELLGAEASEPAGPFAPVRVGTDLTIDFDDRHEVAPGHLGFLVDDVVFDRILDRLAGDAAVPFGSGPASGWDRRINHLGGGRGVYVRDPDGHSYEFFTAVP